MPCVRHERQTSLGESGELPDQAVCEHQKGRSSLPCQNNGWMARLRKTSSAIRSRSKGWSS